MFTAQAEQETSLTPTDVAYALKCQSATVVRWMTKGSLLRNGTRLRLQHVRLPGKLRTTKAWVDAFLEAIASDRTGKPDSAPEASSKSPRVVAMHSALAAAGYAPGA